MIIVDEYQLDASESTLQSFVSLFNVEQAHIMSYRIVIQTRL